MKTRKVLKRVSSIVMAAVMTGFSILSSGLLLKTGQAASTSWTKVDGVYVNSLGEEIVGATLKGIDVSYHNKDIDWEQVKASDIDYAIIRCGFGQDYTSQDDVKWKEYADACTELGIPFGTYLYSYATTVSAAKSEAEHVLRVIKDYQLTYPVYYDMEDKKQEETTAKRKAQMAEAFCSIISEAGYQVGIYANTDWFTTKLTDSYFDSCDKWVAQYSSTCKYTGNYRMWQCTSSGQVPGISTKVDLNFWYDEPPVYQGNTPEANTGNSSSFPTTPSVGNPVSGPSVEENPNVGDPSSSGDNQIVGNNPSPEDNPSSGNNSGTENNPGSENKDPSGTITDAENSPGSNPDSNSDSNSDSNPGSESKPSEITKDPGESPETQNNNSSPKEPDKEPNTTLTISQNALTLSYGGTSVLTASETVKWSSSNKEVVKIGSKGKVTPVGVGEAVITAKASSGQTAECKVIIKKPIKDIDIEEIPAQQFTGGQICPEPVVMDEDKTLEKGTDYKISYMDNTKKGTAVITLKGKGYYTGSVDVAFQIIPKEKLAAPVISSIGSKKSVVTLKWKKVSKASGYEIYRATEKKGTYLLQKTLTKKSKVTYKDKKLVKGKKYYYKIRAYKITEDQKQYSAYAKVNIKA